MMTARLHARRLPDARRKMAATLALTVGVLCALLGVSRRAEAYCAASPKNLRIFHYNVHGLPARPGDLDGNEDIYQISDETRMKAIADEILSDDPDVVILNEVWQEDEGGKGTFISKLAKRYPFSIRYVRGYGSSIMPGDSLNDSGLMLFSKDPFIKFSQPVPSDTWGYSGFESCAGSACADWGPLHANDEVAVHTYSYGPPVEYNGADKHAQKAFMMVRLQGACPYTVGFTHTDADEELEDQQARTVELGIIRDVINASLTASQKDQEAVFLVGDLNVDGNAAPSPHHQLPMADGSGSTEYGVQFDSSDPHASASAAFYSCKQPASFGSCLFSQGGKMLTDSWAYETSPTDYGQTNHGTANAFDFNFANDSGQRLDYIFHNNPKSPEGLAPFMCMQHITRDFKLVDPPRSDHMALRADFNGSFARCNAREKFSATNPTGPAMGAEPVVFDATGNKTFMDANTKLRFPGSNQWYIVKDKGTFSVAVTDGVNMSPKIGAAVYHHGDLSREKVVFHKETSIWTPTFPEAKPVIGLKYQFDDPPYYIRVYGMGNAGLLPSDPNFHKADRSYPSASGGVNYRVSFHMSRCASFDDSCSLTAGSVQQMDWPNQAINGDDMAYFTFYADAAETTGGVSFPSIDFYVEPNLGYTNLGFDANRVRFFKADTYQKTHGDCWEGAAPPCNDDMEGVIGSWSPPVDHEGMPNAKETRGTVVSGALPPDTIGTPKKYLLKLGRPDPALAFSEWVRYETSLTYFLPDAGNKSMTCHIQQSYMYDDQIGLKVQFDGGEPKTDCSQSSCPQLSTPSSGPASYVGQFDDGGTQHAVGSNFAGPFTEYALPSLYEDVKNGSDFEYLVYAQNAATTEDPTWTVILDDWRDDAKIFPLGPTEGGDTAESKPRTFYWCGEEGGNNTTANNSVTYPVYQCNDAEFYYTMGYYLTHDDQRQ